MGLGPGQGGGPGEPGNPPSSPGGGEVLGASTENTITGGGGVPASDGGEGSNSSSGETNGGEVLGESTCGTLLNDYLRFGQENDAGEVQKLQGFLNQNLGSTIAVSGVFDEATLAAVNEFQVKYWEEVLLPWVPFGLATEKTPTGYVYKTTKRWINMVNCPDLELPLPQLP